MKVLINQTTGYLFADVVNAMAKRNDVVLICSDKADKYVTIDGAVKKERIIAYDKSSTLKRVWTWSIGTFQIWWKVITKYSKAELLIVSNPPFANLLALVLPNKVISHLVYDIYPEVLISGHILSEGNFITHLWRKANKRIYNKAQHIYTIGNGMAECLSQYMQKEKIEIVNCWPNEINVQRVEKTKNQFVKEQKIEGKFVVLYSGNMGNTHRMEVLVSVAERLKEYNDIIFFLIGEGGKKKQIEQKIKESGVANVKLLSYQPTEMLSHSLSSADLGVITLDVTASNLSVPSKTFNLMQVGVALLVLGSEDCELGRMMMKYNMGRIFNPDNVNEIAEFVLEMKNNPEQLDEYKKNALNAISDYSVKNAEKFLKC